MKTMLWLVMFVVGAAACGGGSFSAGSGDASTGDGSTLETIFQKRGLPIVPDAGDLYGDRQSLGRRGDRGVEA